MLNFLKKLFGIKITKAPVVVISGEETKTYNSVDEAEKDPGITQDKIENMKKAGEILKELKN